MPIPGPHSKPAESPFPLWNLEQQVISMHIKIWKHIIAYQPGFTVKISWWVLRTTITWALCQSLSGWKHQCCFNNVLQVILSRPGGSTRIHRYICESCFQLKRRYQCSAFPCKGQVRAAHVPRAVAGSVVVWGREGNLKPGRRNSHASVHVSIFSWIFPVPEQSRG